MSQGEVIRTGGGRFDPTEQNVYFIASGPGRLVLTLDVNDHLLVAVNELDRESVSLVERWLDEDSKKRIFLDSGVYNLAMEYARLHSVSMDTALSTAPRDMDDFEPLFDRYVSVVRRLEKKLWCYIEIDQGGRENKIKTRARLEALGLRPTPVYHPLNDGWDYFDYLAKRYDRICFGNIVKANPAERKRLIATAWERHRKYPNLWIHFLGLTPNQWLNALPMNSGDSSSWLHPIRWTEFPIHCDGHRLEDMDRGYRYLLENAGGKAADANGANKAVKLCGYKSRMDMLVWRQHMQCLTELGCELYPAPYGEVKRAAVT